MSRRNAYHTGPPSDHFDGLRFFNPDRPFTERGLADILRWQLGGGRAKWPAHVPVEPVRPATRVDGVAITMVGHASVLIQLGGFNLLVDPVWSERASPVRFAGPRRVTEPGVRFEDLPPIDAVLVTHNHYDHLDLATLGRLHQAGSPTVITPLGNDRIIARVMPAANVISLDWHEQHRVAEQLSVTCVPSYHWSARGQFDHRMALWGGFVVRAGDRLVYNVGDTGYGEGAIFRDVGKRYGKPDVAIIPIGAYAPRWFMRDQHVEPEEAVRIMRDCGARQAVGVHWGTFQLTDEPRDEPKLKLRQALASRDIAAERFIALEPGAMFKA